MRTVYDTHRYILDPHTAIAYGASLSFEPASKISPHILLATAHPIKFSEVVKDTLSLDPEMPESISDLFTKAQIKTKIAADYQAFREQVLLNR